MAANSGRYTRTDWQYGNILPRTAGFAVLVAVWPMIVGFVPCSTRGEVTHSYKQQRYLHYPIDGGAFHQSLFVFSGTVPGYQIQPEEWLVLCSKRLKLIKTTIMQKDYGKTTTGEVESHLPRLFCCMKHYLITAAIR